MGASWAARFLWDVLIRLLAVMLGLVTLVVAMLGITSPEVASDCGACIFAYTDDSPSQDTTWTAPSGHVVCKIGVKAGSGDKNIPQYWFTEDGSDGCYEASGLGTQTARIRKVGDGPDCKDISHVDRYKRLPCPTATPTATDTPTATPTPTPTATDTATDTPTPTNTPTDTPMPSATPTHTASPTSTPTASPTPSVTTTPTPTPTGTLATATASPTPTATPTVAPSVTTTPDTPGETVTPSVTTTPTKTPTLVTPSVTTTPKPEPTVTPSVTTTPTPVRFLPSTGEDRKTPLLIAAVIALGGLWIMTIGAFVIDALGTKPRRKKEKGQDHDETYMER